MAETCRKLDPDFQKGSSVTEIERLNAIDVAVEAETKCLSEMVALC
jgi:hypothetical protein